MMKRRLQCRRSALWFALLVLGCGDSDGQQSNPMGAPGGAGMQSSAAGATPAAQAGTGAAGMSAAPAGSSAGAAGGTRAVPPPTAGGTPAAGSGGGSGASGAAGESSGGAGGMPPSSAGAGGTTAMPMSGAACDRACLTGWNDAYLMALIANDATKLKTAPNVKFTENGKTLMLGEGLWAVASELGSYRQDFAEVPAGQTAGFVSLRDERGDVLLAFRLKVVDGAVSEIETTVCRSGEATFFSPRSLMHKPLYDQEVPAGERMPRDEMIAIVDLYFEGIETSDGSKIPFDAGARRNENGSNTGSGMGLQNVAMFSYIDQIDRRYVLVDEERGNVLPWVLFQIPMGLGGSRTLHLAELFKVQSGKIMDIQAIMVNQPLGTPSGWE